MKKKSVVKEAKEVEEAELAQRVQLAQALPAQLVLQDQVKDLLVELVLPVPQELQARYGCSGSNWLSWYYRCNRRSRRNIRFCLCL